MKEIIDRILEGKFDYDNGILDFSEAKIEITLSKGESCEGSFMVSGSGARMTEGFVFSSDARMECLTESFSGNQAEIGYIFHGNGLEEGETLKGNFYIVSSQGEYTLPFVITVIRPALDSSMGSIRNLFHFANLAKSNWQEAVRLFYDTRFKQIFIDNDKKYEKLYEGLSCYAGKERNVEEFLIAIHKKQAVRYNVGEEKISISAQEAFGRHEIILTKNGWGYTHLWVETDGSFLSVEKDCLNDDDFIGNHCGFYYYIDKDRLHDGVNYGELHFYNGFVDIRLSVEVRNAEEVFQKKSMLREKQDRVLHMMEYYGAFRMKKISTKTWLQKNYELIEDWMELDESDPEPKLYHAHLLLTEQRMNEAGWVLERAKTAILQSKDMDAALWCYYLYLSTLRNREESYVNQIAAEVEGNYKREPENWRLGWLLLYLSPEYGNSYSKKWLFIREQFERGCNSPVFYIEALIMMRQEPSLFMELGTFEMQTLRYAAKHELLTEEIILQLHYIVPRVKEFSPGLLSILQAAYRIRKDSETLQNICTLLIKGGRQKKEDFAWYAAGVEENLRITRLYEYYMYSLDIGEMKKLPKVIYMYFAYNNTLDWKKSAYLYASLVKNRESLPDLYENEQFHIQEFALNMIRAGKINENLAYLYKQVVSPSLLDEEMIRKLSALLFSVRVYVPDRRIKRLVVLRPKESGEESYPLIEREAVVPLYGEDYTLLMEDGEGGRYVPGEDVRIERMPALGRLASEVASADFETVPLQVYLTSGDRAEKAVHEQNARRYRCMLDDERIDENYKSVIIPGMVHYYYDMDEMEELDSLLLSIHPESLNGAKRGEIIWYLVLREYLDRAVEWVIRYGPAGAEPKILVRLASKVIQQMEEYHRDREILIICTYAFERGKYDMITLQYLMDFFEGSTKMLRNIWKAARDRGMEIQSFSERILTQMLFSGCYIGERTDIFRSYLEGEASLPLEKAFLAECSYDYFVRDKVTDIFVFEDMEKLMKHGEQLQKVCLLAYTKYYAENRNEMQEDRQELIGRCLRRLLEDNAVLPYFAEYTDMFPFMYRFYDKTILEYKTRPGRKAVIHYLIEHKENSAGEYRSMEMKDVYGGVCSCFFILFFGEKLLYYITEEYTDKETSEDGAIKQEELTESGNISRSDMGRDMVSNRFSMLNDIVTAETLQDYKTLDTLLEEYETTDYLQKELFKLQ